MECKAKIFCQNWHLNIENNFTTYKVQIKESKSACIGFFLRLSHCKIAHRLKKKRGRNSGKSGNIKCNEASHCSGSLLELYAWDKPWLNGF
jgi:hypothetical protein